MVQKHSVQPNGLQPARLLCPWNSPGKNTGVDCHSLLQENLLNSGIEPPSAELQADPLLSEPLGKPRRILGQNNSEIPFLKRYFTIDDTQQAYFHGWYHAITFSQFSTDSHLTLCSHGSPHPMISRLQPHWKLTWRLDPHFLLQPVAIPMFYQQELPWGYSNLSAANERWLCNKYVGGQGRQKQKYRKPS